jgi:starch synthase
MESAVRELGIDPEKPIVLFVGRITRQKGIHLLLDVVPKLPQETQVVFCAGAADDERLRESYIKSVEKLCNSGYQVHWLEGLFGEDLVPLYSHATVLCTPSMWEGFPLVNLEAMACGLPIVASRCSGNIEQIVNGVNGFFIESEICSSAFLPVDSSHFVNELCEKLTRVISNPVLRKELSEESIKIVKREWSWKSVAEKNIFLYRSLVTEPRDV